MSDKNLYLAHRQWADRPADEGFNAFPPLLDKLQSRYDLSSTVTLNLPEIATEGEINADLEADEVELINPTGERFRFTPWGFRSLCRKVGAHAEFLRKLPAQNVAADLQVLLSGKAAQYEDDADEGGNWTEDQQVLTLRDPEGIRRVRHIGSSRYGRIWDLDVAKWAAGVQDQYSLTVPPAISATPRGLYAGDQDCFFFMVSENAVEVKRPDGTPESLGRGIMVWNSEVGKRTFGLCTFLYQYICGNHIVWGAQDVQTLETRHVGEAFQRATADLMPGVAGYLNSSSQGEADLLNLAMRTRISDSPLEAVRLLRTKGLSKGVAQDVVTLANTDPTNLGLDPLSWMAIVNGVTLKARDLPNGDARTVLQAKGAGFLSALKG